MRKVKKNNYSEEIPLDDYEKGLEEFIDRGEFVSSPDFKKTKQMFKEMAKKHVILKKSKRITLRIKSEDLIKLKARATKNHIPYQTLIGLLINNYTEGKIKLNINS